MPFRLVVLVHLGRLPVDQRIFYQFCVLQLKALALAKPKRVVKLIRIKRNNHKQEW